MDDVIGLVIPFFGLILAGFMVALLTRQPLEVLGWMNTFIIYLALPALYFQLLSKTPIEQLTAWGYIFGGCYLMLSWIGDCPPFWVYTAVLLASWHLRGTRSACSHHASRW